MLIGKYWDEQAQRHCWAEGKDFDDLVFKMKSELDYFGSDTDINPAKIEVWKAAKMKVVARYEIEADD